MGWSTVKAILGNKIMPGLGDRYLARTGYEAQQYDGAVATDRADNLYQPVDDQRDFGAHGDFDYRARDFSWQLWASQNRGWLALAGLIGLFGCLLRGRSSGRLPSAGSIPPTGVNTQLPAREQTADH